MPGRFHRRATHRRATHLALLLAAPALLLVHTACAGPSRTVDRSLLKGLSLEHKLLLFDAENELNIAIDQRDLARMDVKRVGREIRRVERALDEAEDEEDLAERLDDKKTLEVVTLSIEELEARLDFLEEKLDWARATVRLEERRLLTGLARFELSKARLVVNHKLKGAGSIDLAAFEEQVQDYREEEKEVEEGVEQQRQAMEERREVWEGLRTRLADLSGGKRGTPWELEGEE